MMDFIFSYENMWFTVSLVLLLVIAILEGVTTLLGVAVSSFIESIFPTIDADVTAPDDLGITGFLSGVLGWINIGRVPFLMLVVLFLFVFGSMGLTLQFFSDRIIGKLLPAGIAVLLVFIPVLICVRYMSRFTSYLIPEDETESVSEKSFIGMVAVVTLGEARFGKPAEAKLKDVFGRSHYILVEPEEKEDVFPSGSKVLIVRQKSALFFAIWNPNTSLSDDIGE